MIRTIISLPDTDKTWLDAYSHREHHSKAEIIRAALRAFRRSIEGGGPRLSLKATAGLWRRRRVNALSYVRRIRAEWDRK